jgi:sugar phosphate isomerase/epimerase
MIDRRTFVRQAGAFASAAFMLPMAQQRQRYKMGLQLYTMRAAMAQDVDGTLKRIAALGYEEAETYGFDPQSIGYYGMPAKVFGQKLRELKITTPSGHYDLNRYASAPMDDLKRYVDRCIEGAQAVGHSYITWPLLDPPDRTIDRFKAVAERLNIIGAQIKKAGLELAYHNHDFEFVEQNGQIGYDVILKETDPALVKLQIDLYWIAHGSKLSPHEWFTRAPGRFVMWHVKDMHKVNRGYTELGNGSIDFTKIWPDTTLAGMKHFFVEQGGNFTYDPFRSITDSADYVKRVLLKS